MYVKNMQIVSKFSSSGGDDDYVMLNASRSISVLDSRGHYVYVESYEIEDLIKALQMAKKEYFGG